MLLRRVLRSEPGCDVVEARDGLAAWEMLQEGLLPTLITLDIMMPRMDGLDLLARIRATPRLHGVKVIMCTAVNDRPRMVSANSLDIDGYVLKPFTAKNILDQVHHVLHKGPPATPGIPAASEAPPRQPVDWKTRAGDLEALARSTSNNLTVINMALAADDREAAMSEVESVRTAGQRLGMAALAGAANRLGAAILLGDALNTTAGLEAVEAARKEVMVILAGLSRSNAASSDASAPANTPPDTRS